MLAFTTLLVLLYGVASGSGVVILPGGDPKPYGGPAGASSVDQFFRQSAGREFLDNSAQVIMSSMDKTSFTQANGIVPSGDSFIRGAIQAWGEHLHLVIRPEEVWFTILVQMNFYMNSHAEDIRNLFVNFTGQQTISIEDITWYSVIRRFDQEIQKRVKTPWLLDWIRPNFTTTTEADLMTANVLMMGLTKAYFRFEAGIICGLPSVTLLGTQSDWEALLAKLDHLKEFGDEPTAYRARLKPILARFVKSFKEPNSDATRTFWDQIVSAQPSHLCGAPPYYVSGWITGFQYWDPKGEPWGRGSGDLKLDGVTYPSVDLTASNAPMGYATVPLIMLDFNKTARYEAYLAAGTMGKQITPGPPSGYLDALKLAHKDVAVYDKADQATLRPLSSWMLYGPVPHNSTGASAHLAKTEISGLMDSVGKNFNAAQCQLTQ